MSDKTIEKVQADLEAVDTIAFDAMSRRVGASGSPVGGVSPEQFGEIYPNVRAVLVALSAVWFMPTKVKEILDVLVKYLDAATGAT